MKKILLIIDHYPISPRMKKTVATLQKKGFMTKVLAWNREGKVVSDDKDIETFDQDFGYGNKLKKLLHLYSFSKKLDLVVKEFNPDYIQSVDFEMQLLSSKHSRNHTLIYEVYDIKFFNNGFVNYVREKIERILLNKVSFVVFASPFFNKYYQILDDKYVVINNMPSRLSNADNEIVLNNLSIEEKKNNRIKIGFVGTVRYYDEFIIAINAISKNDQFEFLIFGSGPDLQKLEDYVDKTGIDCVHFYGRFESESLPTIYSTLDFVWACYPKNDLNVKFAVSNKYFESLVYKTPIIVSDETFLGDLVERDNTGIAVDSSSEAGIEVGLNRLLGNIEYYKSLLESFASTDQNYWESEEVLYNFYDRLKSL